MALSIAPVSEPRTRRPSPEQKLVDSLITLMERGTTPWRRPWDGGSGGHHVNLLSGRRYRGGNPVLLQLGMHLRGSSLPYWCGFAEARTRGLVPRRGSRAVAVLRPQVLRSPGTEGEAGASTDPSDSTGAPRPVVLYRPLPLFNAADLQGEGLPGLIRARRMAEVALQRPEPERLQNAEAVLERWPVPVLRGGDQACYLCDADRIHLPDRNAFHSPEAALATWAHEAIHSTGHPSRLERDLSGVMGAAGAKGAAYAREELVAELGAVLLGDRLEIGNDTAHHAAYLSHWIALLRETPRLLLQVLAEARRAADLICPEPRAAERCAPP
ncbi:MAG: ArdC family protein [Cyanobium sp.]